MTRSNHPTDEAAPADVPARVAAWIARAGVPSPGERVVVACSAGPDSTALLIALARVGCGPLYAVYVDHGLRAGTEAEAVLVAEAAARLGASAECVRVTVERKGNLLAAARAARYRALAEVAQRVGARLVAVGHTATDQAETVLFRQRRGDVAQSYAGMPARRRIAPGIEIIRPLLDVRRDEAAAFARAAGFPVFHDPSNERDDLTRPRLRRWLAEHEGSVGELCRLADVTAAQVAAWDEAAAALGPAGDLDAEAVRAAGPDVILRLLRRAGLHDAGRAHAAAVMHLVSSAAGTSSVDLAAGLVAERRYGRLRLGPPVRDPGDVCIPVAAAGEYPWPFPAAGGALVVLSGGGRLPEGLCLRNLRAGDRLRVRGFRRKLQDVLTDRKVPRPERRRLPLLAAGGEVLWVAGVPGVEGLAGWTVELTSADGGCA